MNSNDALNTLNEIKDIMSRSKRFQTISGGSIIIIGIYASIVALGAWIILGDHAPYGWLPKYWQDFAINTPRHTIVAAAIAAGLVAVSFGTVSILSYLKTKRLNHHFAFDATVRRALANFMVPAVSGALFCVAMLVQQHYGLTSSIMLIFYGLSLINCSHYATSSIAALGYGELILGLVDCFVIDHALLFWFLGFGLLHVVYGIYYLIKEK
ncbi:MAG: hypothetical protein KBT28_12680 [Bacteroidales bacterium]|nr:hypothetical protein [Candidatus Colimorpha merdihippi]